MTRVILPGTPPPRRRVNALVFLVFIIVVAAAALVSWTICSATSELEHRFVTASLSLRAAVFVDHVDTLIQLEPAAGMPLTRRSDAPLITSRDQLGRWVAGVSDVSGEGHRGDVIICAQQSYFEMVHPGLDRFMLYDAFVGEVSEAFGMNSLFVQSSQALEFQLVGINARSMDIFIESFVERQPVGGEVERQGQLALSKLVMKLSRPVSEGPLIEILPGYVPTRGGSEVDLAFTVPPPGTVVFLEPVRFETIKILGGTCRRFVADSSLTEGETGERSQESPKVVQVEVLFHDSELSQFELVLPVRRVVLQDVTGTVSAGDREHTLSIPSQLEISGEDVEFFLDARKNQLSIVGEATSVRANGVQLLPQRYPWVPVAVIAIVSAFMGALGGGLLVSYLGRKF